MAEVIAMRQQNGFGFSVERCDGELLVKLFDDTYQYSEEMLVPPSQLSKLITVLMDAHAVTEDCHD